MLMFEAQTEATKKLPTVVIKNTTQQSPYKQGTEITGQAECIFWDRVLICLVQEEPFAAEKHLSRVYVPAVYLYTHFYQGI